MAEATLETERHGYYVCAGCNLLKPWSDGGDDDMPDHCDDCWGLHHGCISAPDPFPNKELANASP